MCATLLTGETACPFTEEAYTSSIPLTEREGYCYSLLRRCFTCPMHNHSHYEIALVTSGRITHFVGGQAVLLSPGDLFFARPQDTHALDARDGATLVNIAFSKAHFKRFLQYAADLPLPFERLHDALPLTVSVDPARASDAYERFNARRDAVGAPVQLALRELLCELFGMLLCEPTAAAACPEWLDALCRKMRQYENFTAPADTMVRLSGYSREHLSRSMKRYLGVTPSEFLCGLRLDHAAGLLRLTSMPVLDVCMASGFENPAYFHRRFREKFGMTPGRFRAAVNGKSQ